MALRPQPSPGTAAVVVGRRRRLVSTMLLAGAVAGVGVPTVVAAQQPSSVEVMGPDLVGTDVGDLTLVYRGAEITPAQLRDLNDDGKAMVGVHNSELSCQGVALYFDTPTDADAYGRDYATRERERAVNEAATDGADPCSGYEDAPRFLDSRR